MKNQKLFDALVKLNTAVIDLHESIGLACEHTVDELKKSGMTFPEIKICYLNNA